MLATSGHEVTKQEQIQAMHAGLLVEFDLVIT